MSAMEWGFHYSGPREPTQDLNCVTCLAMVQKRCPTHGHGFDLIGCAHCKAAAGGQCHSHWGLDAALKAFAPSAEVKDDFSLAVKIVVAEPLVAGKPNVTVRMNGNRDVERPGTRELHIEITQI